MPLRIALAAAALVLLAACSTAAPATSGTPQTVAERGETLYDRHCLVCHGNPVTGEGRTELASIHGPDGHTWHHADQQLIEIVLGDFTYPTRTMPSFEDRLTEDDVRAIDGEFPDLTAGLTEPLQDRRVATGGLNGKREDGQRVQTFGHVRIRQARQLQ